VREQRRAGGGADPHAAAEEARGAQHEARRGPVAEGDGQGHGRPRAPAARDRGQGRVGDRSPRRDGDDQAAPAGRREERSTRAPVANAAASRCAARCSNTRTCCCSTSRPTTSTSRPCVARGDARGVQGHRRRHHARSVLPRQRRRVDARGLARPRDPLRGQLLRVPDPARKRMEVQECRSSGVPSSSTASSSGSA
jgi:hypothetical protein